MSLVKKVSKLLEDVGIHLDEDKILKTEVRLVNKNEPYVCLVKGSSSYYVVLVSKDGMQCSCPAGSTNKLCYHQIAVLEYLVSGGKMSFKDGLLVLLERLGRWKIC